ncbi:hypothetical protein DP116_13795 [Brasilonema bromeliae SPC951]|uniref:Transposase zinc-ribbon domain-containing protein n=1 Tax=Brasilonema bromeliae SPC951 TaxID=385972 RepID=A0ABX1P979_9CYAN|nr:hypothetical protein [Brasilonema bromeliae]NMG20471.1 hypothetical protein [Brasilonema bromeliae SPC951]
MNECPCCSHQLLRHIRHQQVYWFCSSCRQEMPNFCNSVKASNLFSTTLSQRLSGYSMKVNTI